MNEGIISTTYYKLNIWQKSMEQEKMSGDVVNII